ncbi:hypothetical protein, partial [Aquabacterium sp.]|uniref:hypothetical protein n=1 Tax=Aquabacterium sp. TaxID=1872578 RepID=UPI0025BE5841
RRVTRFLSPYSLLAKLSCCFICALLALDLLPIYAAQIVPELISDSLDQTASANPGAIQSLSRLMDGMISDQLQTARIGS